MIYITLLKQIERFIIMNPNNAGSQTVVALAKAERKEVGDFLLDFDIRSIASLRKIIPNAFPRVLRDVPLVCDQNIHGTWRVSAMPLIKRGRVYDTGGYIL